MSDNNEYSFPDHPYDADEEVRILIRDVLETLDELFVRDGGRLYVVCEDGRYRPLDDRVANQLEDLRWTAEISRWRRNGRVGKLPETVRVSLGRARTWFDRWRVMRGRDFWSVHIKADDEQLMNYYTEEGARVK